MKGGKLGNPQYLYYVIHNICHLQPIGTKSVITPVSIRIQNNRFTHRIAISAKQITGVYLIRGRSNVSRYNTFNKYLLILFFILSVLNDCIIDIQVSNISYWCSKNMIHKTYKLIINKSVKCGQISTQVLNFGTLPKIAEHQNLIVEQQVVQVVGRQMNSTFKPNESSQSSQTFKVSRTRQYTNSSILYKYMSWMQTNLKSLIVSWPDHVEPLFTRS